MVSQYVSDELWRPTPRDGQTNATETCIPGPFGTPPPASFLCGSRCAQPSVQAMGCNPIKFLLAIVALCSPPARRKAQIGQGIAPAAVSAVGFTPGRMSSSIWPTVIIDWAS